MLQEVLLALLMVSFVTGSQYEDVCAVESVIQLSKLHSLHYNHMAKATRIREIESSLAGLQTTRQVLESELNVTRREITELELSIEALTQTVPQLEKLQASHTCDRQTPRDCCEVTNEVHNIM